MPAPGAAQARRTNVPWRHVDPLLAAVVLFISAFGCLMIYTATRDSLEAQGLSPEYYVKKQALFVLVGVFVMVAAAAVDYRRLRDWAPAIYGLCVLVLVAVYVVGHKSKGAQAWFQIGSYQFEPSEFAKIGLIVALASYCAAAKGRLPGRALVVVLVLAALPFVLVYKQPDLGTALVLAAVLVAVLLIAGTPAKHLGALGVLALILAVGVVHFGVLKSYQEQRLISFVDSPSQPSAALLATNAGASQYNTAQSKLAIADGGVRGQGIGHGSRTNGSYVPELWTDFIFAAVGEQVGLIGSLLLLMLFAVVIWRTWRAAVLARDLLGTLICVGVLAMMMFQVFENVGMAMGVMPVAGIPLPFMSYGGSAVLATFAGIGLVQNVRMRRFN